MTEMSFPRPRMKINGPPTFRIATERKKEKLMVNVKK